MPSSSGTPRRPSRPSPSMGAPGMRLPLRAKPGDIDRLLYPRVAHLRDAYRRTSDPQLIRLAAEGLISELSPVPAFGASFQASRLYALVAETHLDEGKDADSLSAGLLAIETATDILGRVDMASDDLFRTRVTYALHAGVLTKALGRYEESLEWMKAEKDWLIGSKGLTTLDTVMLDRQEVLMRQEARGFEALLRDALAYRTIKPMEYYASIRRVFEFCLNNQRLPEASSLFPEFRRAFAAVAKALPVLSHISFAKNVGHYELLRGHALEAERVLSRCLLRAQALQLHGQVRQITALRNSLHDGQPPVLLPFLVL